MHSIENQILIFVIAVVLFIMSTPHVLQKNQKENKRKLYVMEATEDHFLSQHPKKHEIYQKYSMQLNSSGF